MEVVVVTERRFVLDDNGLPCCTDGSRGYRFWCKYLQHFERVLVLARLSDTQLSSGHAVEGPRVSLLPVSDFRGLQGLLSRRRAIKKEVSRLSQSGRTFILRVPGLLGETARQQLTQHGYPFGVEVVGDPRDVFARGVFKHPLRAWIRRIAAGNQRQQCRQAAAAAYVTARTLQKRYPPGAATYATSYSSVDLTDESFIDAAKVHDSAPCSPRIITVGSLEHHYKGTHVLIAAAAAAVDQGIDLELIVVGDGKLRNRLENQVKRLGIHPRVHFRGRLAAGSAVREQLDRADVFVMPSLTEGLPRALIEAMARGLPCIGSNVGGIPELLQPTELVTPGHVPELTAMLTDVLRDPHRLQRLSKDNLDTARRFHHLVLDQRRTRFYQALAERTEAFWAASRPTAA